MKYYQRKSFYIGLVIIGIMAFFAIPKCQEVPVIEYNKELPLPKIEEVKKPYVKPEVKPNLPVKKRKIYKPKDKALRDSIVKGKVVVDIALVNGGIELTNADSVGNITKDFIPVDIKLPEGADTLKIDEKGVELVQEKKTKVGKIFQGIGKGTKKFVKGAGKGLAVIGGAVVVGAVIVAGAPVAVVAVVGGVTVIVVVAVLASGG